MIIIGHRGAKGLAPENTLKSLAKALEYLEGTDGMIEFDVRVTADNVPVLHHDPHVTDASGAQLAIADHSFKELKEHFPDMTTFKDALTLISGRVVAYVEVKPGEPISPIAKELTSVMATGYDASKLRLASKNQKTLRELHRRFPAVPTIVIEPWSGVRAHWRARQVNAVAVCMNQLWLWSGFIRSVRRSKLDLYTYTLNDVAKARRWQTYGLAGVVTDYPDRFVDKH